MARDYTITEYTSDQMLLACDRYKAVTGRSHEDFWQDWIGLSTHPHSSFMPGMRCYVRHKRLEMLMSPHWYTLMKIWIAKNESTPR